MRSLLLFVACVLCLASAASTNDQQDDEFAQQELLRNLQAMELLASQTQAAADTFRSEQKLWDESLADAAQLGQDQHLLMHRHLQLLQVDQQGELPLEAEQGAQLSGTVSSSFNETIFNEPFVLPSHQSLQIPHCFSSESECTLAFWLLVAPSEELLSDSPEHNLVSIVSSNLPPGLLSPSLLLGVAPEKMKPFVAINSLSSGALVGVFSHTEIQPNSWVHLALSVDSSSLTLFVNGQRTAVLPIPISTHPTCSSSMIERGRSPPSNQSISTVGNNQASVSGKNPFGWTSDGCEQCRLWPFNTTLGFGGNRATPGADAVVARATLYNTKIDGSGAWYYVHHVWYLCSIF
jgi:hypothetical protein